MLLDAYLIQSIYTIIKPLVDDEEEEEKYAESHNQSP